VTDGEDALFNEMVFDASPDAVIVRPGDTLIVRTGDIYSAKQMDEYREALKESLPGIRVLFVRSDQLLVYRPDPDVSRD
jgi:hypothetical protein